MSLRYASKSAYEVKLLNGQRVYVIADDVQGALTQAKEACAPDNYGLGTPSGVEYLGVGLVPIGEPQAVKP